MVVITSPSIETVRSYCICSIFDEASRCVDEEACLLIRPLDLDPTLVMSQEIHRSRAISAVIIGEIDD